MVSTFKYVKWRSSILHRAIPYVFSSVIAVNVHKMQLMITSSPLSPNQLKGILQRTQIWTTLAYSNECVLYSTLFPYDNVARSEMSETDFCVFISFTGTHSPRNCSYRYACAGSIIKDCDYQYRIIISLSFSYQGVSVLIRTYVYDLVYCVFMYNSHPSYHV